MSSINNSNISSNKPSQETINLAKAAKAATKATQASPDAADILNDSSKTRTSIVADKKPSLLAKSFAVLSNNKAKKADVAANKAAFAQLPANAAVSNKKASGTSAEPILESSSAVRAGYSAGPALGVGIKRILSSIASGVSAAWAAVQGAATGLLSSVKGFFSSIKDAKANKVAFQELPAADVFKGTEAETSAALTEKNVAISNKQAFAELPKFSAVSTSNRSTVVDSGIGQNEPKSYLQMAKGIFGLA